MISSRKNQDVKIRRGQYWRNKVSGMVMKTMRKDADDSWKCMRADGKSRLHSVHKIRCHDLYKKYEFIL